MKPILFGLATGIGVQAWRNFPADGPLTPNGALLVGLLAVVLAYAIGRGRRHFSPAIAVATAEATAVAAATADQRLAVIINNGGERAGSAFEGVRIPNESSAPWLVGSAAPTPELSLDQLDGMDLADLLDQHEQEHDQS